MRHVGLALDTARLAALAPDLDLVEVERALAVIPLVCRGAAGPIGQLSQAERFHWLVAPRSAIIQTSPVHCGLCADPAVALWPSARNHGAPATPWRRDRTQHRY